MGFMDRMTVWVEEKVGPIAAKISSMGFVNAVSSCYAALMPVILLGAFASMFAGITWTPYTNFITNTGINDLLNLIVQLTTNCLALYVSFSIAWSAMKKDYPGAAPIVGIISLVVFLILNPLAIIEGTKYISFSYMGAKGLIGAMISGYLVYLCVFFCFKHNINIKMPKGVPPAIAEAFRALIPGTFCTIIALVIYQVTITSGGIISIIYVLLAAPFSALADNVVTFCLIDTLRQFLWFFGIHGGNVMSAISNILYQAPTVENIANWAAGLPLTNMITEGTDAVAGGGQNFCFCLCILSCFSKKKQLRELGKMSVLPGLFKITEPIRFGLPLVLNSYFIIPILLTDILQHVFTYLLTYVGIMPIAHSTTLTAPFPIVICMNIGIIPGIIWSVVLVAMGLIIGYPFFKAYEKSLPEEETEMEGLDD